MITQKVLYISTKHLNKKDIGWLKSEENTYGAVYDISKYDNITDLMFYINDTDIANDICVPDNIKSCILIADQLNCSVIRFNDDNQPVPYLNANTVKHNGVSEYENRLYTKRMLTFGIKDMTDDEIRFMNNICETNDDVFKKEEFGWYITCGWTPESFLGKLIRSITAKYDDLIFDIVCIDNEY